MRLLKTTVCGLIIATAHPVATGQLPANLKKIVKPQQTSSKNHERNPGMGTTVTATGSSEVAEARANRLNIKMGAARVAELKAYYEPKGRAAAETMTFAETPWTLDCSRPNHVTRNLEIMDWAHLSQQMEADKKEYPELFKYYGIPSSKYGHMEYGGQTSNQNPLPFSGDLVAVNRALENLYEWQAVMQKGGKQLVQNLQTMLNSAANAPKAGQMMCYRNTARLLEAMKIAIPAHTSIAELAQQAQQAINRSVENMGTLITGSMHRQHIGEIVVYSSPQQPGKENAAQILETIVPLQDRAFIMGYFAGTNREGGGIPTLGWTVVDAQTTAAKAAAPDYPARYHQPMYEGAQVKNQMQDKAWMAFELLPNVSTANYTSHLQFIPHLNFAKWLSQQAPGRLTLVFRWGRQNLMAASRPVTFVLTPESQQALRKYYDALMARKIAAVSFPAGCTDMRSTLTNLADLDKYGTILKINYSPTGNIMKPFPHQKEIDWNTASGYAVFENNGKCEVVQLEFRKKPADTQWKWWSVGALPTHLTLEGGTMRITPEVLNNGYEMKKENAALCKPW